MNEQTIFDLGYLYPKQINGIWCAINRIAFTTGLFVNIDRIGYSYRYCFHTFKEAKDALANYEDTNHHPPGDWIKRKGKEGDLINPNKTSQ